MQLSATVTVDYFALHSLHHNVSSVLPVIMMQTEMK